MNATMRAREFEVDSVLAFLAWDVFLTRIIDKPRAENYRETNPNDNCVKARAHAALPLFFFFSDFSGTFSLIIFSISAFMAFSSIPGMKVVATA
jgi:hypothetical protein